ncbi:MAG: HEPN domain-containing protein [Synergistaceae bacterium]|nr:HEPN domain-containing protein [Synergistaceae bacterium]
MTLSDEDRDVMIKICMEKSEEAFEEAVILSEKDRYNGAANRAYYSIFQAENALLLTKKIFGNTHKHVHNSISNEFVKSGELPDDIYKRIKEIERIRAIGDYSKIKSVTKEEMEETISEAKKILGIAKELIADFLLEQEKTNGLGER